MKILPEPTLKYRLVKFVTRHKLALTVMLLFFIAFSIALINILMIVQSSEAEIQKLTDGITETQLFYVNAKARADSLEIVLNNTTALLDTLSTETVREQLQEVDTRVQELSGRLETLQQIINPETAGVILNIERMSKEIDAREAFEADINKSIVSYEGRIQSLENWIRTMLVSVIALFATVIGYILQQSMTVLKKKKK